MRNAFVVAGVLLLLAGCTIKETKPPLPYEPPLLNEIQLEQVWFDFLSVPTERDPYQSLQPVVVGETVFAASAEGQLFAYNLQTGKVLYTAQLPGAVSGGLSTDGESLFVATENGELLALDLTATEQWRASLTSRALSPAAVDGQRVLVHTQDGKLAALDRTTGQQLWLYDSGIPRLTIMGTATPLLVGDRAISSFANGKLVALNAETGEVVWEFRLAQAEGRSDLERLTDADGSPTLVQSYVVGSAINGQTLAVDVAAGRRLASLPFASNHSVIAAGGQFNLVLEDDSLVAVSPRSGEEVWRQDGLKGRVLTDAVVWGDYLVLGDKRGWVILVDLKDGRLVGGAEADYLGLVSRPVVAGEYLLVQGRSGRLRAYRFK